MRTARSQRRNSVPSIWSPDIGCFIIGGGPSLLSEQVETLRGFNCIGVNNSGFLFPWIDVLFFGDQQWYDWNTRKLKLYPGIIYTNCNASLFQQQKLVIAIDRGKSTGIDPRPSNISWNYNSGFASINLAYHLGARKIGLLGFDMKRINGKSNFHNDHLRRNLTEKEMARRERFKDQVYINFLRAAPAIKKDADALGLEIINFTQGSALTEFPFLTMEEIPETWQRKTLSRCLKAEGTSIPST